MNRLDTAPAGTAANLDITRRISLLIDCDPTRPRGTSATDAQRDAARGLADAVREFIASQTGVQPTLVCDSGNGVHLYYRLDLPPEDTRVQALLLKLNAVFGTDLVKVDTVVHDASRISRLPGSINTKGDTPRLCRTIEVNPDATTLTGGMIDAMTAELPSPKPTAKNATTEQTKTTQEDISRTGNGIDRRQGNSDGTRP